MLLVISPAKTLDYESRVRTVRHTEADFLAESDQLIALMRKKKPAQLRALMGISENLAELNHARFQNWEKAHTPTNSRQALLAFMGDVYTGLDARSLDSTDLTFAQRHLRILSGLYGVLRPLDRMQAYRLEMGTSVKHPRGRDLYDFWGDAPTEALNEQARSIKTRYLINLASNEYFKVVKLQQLEPQVIQPVFKEQRGDDYRVLSFFAKKARGLMARYIIQNRIRKPAALRDFDLEGYRYNEQLSDSTRYTFTRASA
jgi:uncharacterized protein